MLNCARQYEMVTLFKRNVIDDDFSFNHGCNSILIMVHHHGQLIALTGNQVGAIIMHDIVHHQFHIKDGFVASTIVSSDLAKVIAKAANYKVYETLTGFKYIGEQITLHAKEKFVFGYEESFGFLLNEAVRDKDAFQPMARLLAIVSRAKSLNQTKRIL